MLSLLNIYMVSRRSMERSAAAEEVEIIFYQVIEKDDKKILKPLKFGTKVSLKLVRSITDKTVISNFYETLSKNLMERGIEKGTKVQLRAKFSKNHEIVDPSLKGTIILCEVVV